MTGNWKVTEIIRKLGQFISYHVIEDKKEVEKNRREV